MSPLAPTCLGGAAALVGVDAALELDLFATSLLGVWAEIRRGKKTEEI